MGTYGDTGDYPDAGTLTGTETLLIDDGADTLSTTVQTIANLATNASNLTSGTVADARIASTIARDSEVTSAISTHSGDTDPHGDRAYADSAVSTHSADTTGVHGIADTSALLDTADIGVTVQGYSAVLAGTTASFTTADETKLDGIESGATADQSAAEILAALLTVDGAGSGLDADLLDGQSSAAFEVAGAAAAAQAASQPLDSDLTAIAALTTTSFGRSLLEAANAAALRTLAGLGGAATLNVGTTTGTVAAGDDSRITSAASLGLAYAMSQSVFTP